MTKIAQHKKTTNSKLGYIPEDWKIKKVSQVFDFLSTNSFSRSQMNYSLKAGSIYNIHYGDIHATYKEPILDFDKNKDVPVINDDVELSKTVTFLKDGDLVMADASEDYKGVGETIELANIRKKKVVAGLHTFALRDTNGETTSGFRTYIFKHPVVSKAVKVIATGSKVYGISKTNLAKIDLIFPPLPEQQKIATILSKWDSAIDKLTQLIAGKELQKKGLMQQLLTGELRFPGFEDEWEEVKLGEIVQFLDGRRKPLKSDDRNQIQGDIPYYGASGIIDYVNDYIFNEEIVLLGEDGENILSRNTRLVYHVVGKCWVNNHTHVLKPLKNVDGVFLTESLEMVNYLKYNSGTAQPKLNKATCEKIKISIPTVLEQQKIASVLSEADKEIEILKKELASFQEQKKGLMQVLLTGAVRVKINW